MFVDGLNIKCYVIEIVDEVGIILYIYFKYWVIELNWNLDLV